MEGLEDFTTENDLSGDLFKETKLYDEDDEDAPDYESFDDSDDF